jgi:hypothetical protein
MRALMILMASSLFLMALLSIVLARFVRDEAGPGVERRRHYAAVADPPRFFIEEAVPAGGVMVPVEALLLQLERHVQLERAAAESFLASPTRESLHGRTTSPLMH